MPSLSTYKKLLSPKGRMGEVRKQVSDNAIEQTWWNDLQSRTVYLYDYYHDSEPNLNIGLNPSEDELKTPIDAKYIVTQYGTLSKDQVEYHLMFRPSQECNVEYYSDKFQNRYNAEFPVGLYVDIPDNKGIYRRWIVCSKDYEPQFVKYSILPCNYFYRWIYNNTKYNMWGVARLRNSYNSGVWTDYKMTSVENQDQLWLPMNEISEKFYYDQRIIISALIEKPITWSVSKIENIHPFGINKITLSQTKFDPHTDYVNFETGEMYADYYKTTIPSEDYVNDDSDIATTGTKLKYKGSSPTIKIDGGYRTIYSEDVGVWNFTIDNEDATELLEIIEVSDYEIRIKFLGNEDYLGRALKITNGNSYLYLNIECL